MSALNVLYVHQDGLITGSALSLRNLLLGLDRQRFSPHVLLAREGPARQLYEDLGISVDVLPIRGMWTAPGPRFPKTDYFRNWLALLPNPALRSYLYSRMPTLVHINDKALLSAGLTARQLGLPVVWHLRSTYAVSHSRTQAAISRHVIRRNANRLIAISEDETDGFEDLSNLSVIFNSVDFDQVTRAVSQTSCIIRELSLEGKIVIGTISTAINEVRGTYDFIRAAGLVKKQLPKASFKFIIVAPIPQEPFQGSYQKALDLAKDEQIGQELVITGFREDAMAIMSAMHVILLCNRHRVLGRSPFEAMALGIPVVVTSGHSRRSRVVVDGETALVVEHDNPKVMADSIIKLLFDPVLREHLGKQGKAYARQHFDPQKNAQAVMMIYDQLLFKNEHT